MLPVITGSESSAAAQAAQEGDPETATLYLGNLHPAVTPAVLQEICNQFGNLIHVKVIKDRITGASAGYGFAKFSSKGSAANALAFLHRKQLFGLEVRANWSYVQGSNKDDNGGQFSIFIGDLAQEVTDAILFSALATVGDCTDARVMWDQLTSRSKGYGFASFRSREAAERAIEMFQGQFIGTRRVRCGWAQHKQEDSVELMDYESVDRDPYNTNVYLGNVAPNVTEKDLLQYFSAFGPVLEVKLHKKGGYGFVRFERHDSAVQCIMDTQGQMLFGRVIKCSWGKAPAGVLFAQQHKMLPVMGGLGAGPPGLLQPSPVVAGGQVAMLPPGALPAHQAGAAALVAQPQVVVPGQVLAPAGAVQQVQLQPVQQQVLLVPPPAQHQFQSQLRQGTGALQPLMPGVLQPSAVRPVGMPMAFSAGAGGGAVSLQPEGPTLFFDPVTGMYYQQQYQ